MKILLIASKYDAVTVFNQIMEAINDQWPYVLHGLIKYLIGFPSPYEIPQSNQN